MPTSTALVTVPRAAPRTRFDDIGDDFIAKLVRHKKAVGPLSSKPSAPRPARRRVVQPSQLARPYNRRHVIASKQESLHEFLLYSSVPAPEHSYAPYRVIPPWHQSEVVEQPSSCERTESRARQRDHAPWAASHPDLLCWKDLEPAVVQVARPRRDNRTFDERVEHPRGVRKLAHPGQTDDMDQILSAEARDAPPPAERRGARRASSAPPPGYTPFGTSLTAADEKNYHFVGDPKREAWATRSRCGEWHDPSKINNSPPPPLLVACHPVVSARTFTKALENIVRRPSRRARSHAPACEHDHVDFFTGVCR